MSYDLTWTPTKGPLENRLGYSKYHTILSHEVNRGLILFFRQPGIRMTALTDAYWAAHIRNTARRRNIEGVPRPSIKRSWAEVGDLNNIAESLSTHGRKVSPYKVKMMLGRMEQTPFEEFEGSFQDYLLWVTDPKAYKHDLRLREVATKPRRDPDPYFSSGV